MEGLVRDRLCYCDNCQAMRPFYESSIVPIPGETRRGLYYACAVCNGFLAAFEQVNAEEFREAAKAIEDPELKRLVEV
jgi:hypothetical protein